LFKVPGFESEAQAVWLHSLFTAFATQALLADSPPWQDTGFLLGLTHDIGRISILSFAAECRSRKSEDWGPCPAVVEEVSDLVHARLGAIAVDSWKFGDEFTEVISNHHDPSAIKDHRIVLAQALATRDLLAHRVEDDWSGDEGVMTPELIEMLDDVGVDEEQRMVLVEEVHSDFEAFARSI
jgi:HD-like signal output (HDOD) protein